METIKEIEKRSGLKFNITAGTYKSQKEAKNSFSIFLEKDVVKTIMLEKNIKEIDIKKEFQDFINTYKNNYFLLGIEDYRLVSNICLILNIKLNSTICSYIDSSFGRRRVQRTI